MIAMDPWMRNVLLAVGSALEVTRPQDLEPRLCSVQRMHAPRRSQPVVRSGSSENTENGMGWTSTCIQQAAFDFHYSHLLNVQLS